MNKENPALDLWYTEKDPEKILCFNTCIHGKLVEITIKNATRPSIMGEPFTLDPIAELSFLDSIGNTIVEAVSRALQREKENKNGRDS